MYLSLLFTIHFLINLHAGATGHGQVCCSTSVRRSRDIAATVSPWILGSPVAYHLPSTCCMLAHGLTAIGFCRSGPCPYSSTQVAPASVSWPCIELTGVVLAMSWVRNMHTCLQACIAKHFGYAPVARKVPSTRAYENPGWHYKSWKTFLAVGACLKCFAIAGHGMHTGLRSHALPCLWSFYFSSRNTGILVCSSTV